MEIYRSPNLPHGRVLLACLALGLASLSPALASEAVTKSEVDHERLDQGRAVFLEEAKPPCQICHVLEDAGAKGRVGPNLDEMQPDADMVRAALMSGPGAMPEYSARLDEAQIEAVSLYVAEVSGAAEREAAQDEAAPQGD
jgi:mono/diheme cytochrome c family protein